MGGRIFPAGSVQLFQYIVDVVLNRPYLYEKLIGDFLVCEPFVDQFQYLQLARRELNLRFWL